MKKSNTGNDSMRKTYDFSKAIKNPYIGKLKKQITIRIDKDSLEYFRKMSDATGIPYQNLINLYLRDCSTSKRRLSIDWQPH